MNSIVYMQFIVINVMIIKLEDWMTPEMDDKDEYREHYVH